MVETNSFQLFSSTSRRRIPGSRNVAEALETAKVAVVGQASSAKPHHSSINEPETTTSKTSQPRQKAGVISLDTRRESTSLPSGEGSQTAHGLATSDLRATVQEDVDFKSLGVSPWLCRCAPCITYPSHVHGHSAALSLSLEVQFHSWPEKAVCTEGRGGMALPAVLHGWRSFHGSTSGSSPFLGLCGCMHKAGRASSQGGRDCISVPDNVGEGQP